MDFSNIKTDLRYFSTWKDGQWDEGVLTEDNKVHISEESTALHSSQSCFEGLKAYRTKNGDINLFRPEKNAECMQRSCRRLLMPEIPMGKFVEAVKRVVKINEHFLPPYCTGGTLYIRPYMIG